jgi:hypothetical protein
MRERMVFSSPSILSMPCVIGFGSSGKNAAAGDWPMTATRSKEYIMVRS